VSLAGADDRSRRSGRKRSESRWEDRPTTAAAPHPGWFSTPC